MNRENMLKVADAIEQEIVNFNMSTWVEYGNDSSRGVQAAVKYVNGHIDTCGTIACVGGTANLLDFREQRGNVESKWDRKRRRVRDGRVLQDEAGTNRAARWLGLSDTDADNLFYAREFSRGSGSANSMVAFSIVNENRGLVPNALRWMAESGEVSWKKGFEYARCVHKEKKL
jgi:hypothetical protein